MIHNDPRMVIFEERECCALRAAFKENRTVINDFLKDFVPVRIIELCGRILHCTQKLGWVPGVEDHKTVYREIAAMEIKRLTSIKNPALNCGCKAERHLESLQKVIQLMGGISSTVN